MYDTIYPPTGHTLIEDIDLIALIKAVEKVIALSESGHVSWGGDYKAYQQLKKSLEVFL